MKKSYLILAFGAWLTIGAGIPTARADVAFSAGLQITAVADFYDPLASYGAWVDVPRYGRCWHPEGVERDWRPYADGHWEWTDVGWYWVSDEPWSWACYHYGYWNYDDSYGWVWIPGTQWAPSWVTWRESDDYIGWAPCGPRGVVLAPAFFIFVGIGHFHDHITPSGVIVNNTTIIKRTRVINNIRRENRTIDGARTQVMVNQGPTFDRVQKSSGTRFVQRPIREVVSQTPAPERIRRIQSGPGAIERPVLREDSRGRFGNNRNQTQPSASQRSAPERTTPDRNQRDSTTYRQQQQTTPPTGQDQQRLYRESTPTPPRPTGRDQERIYRESPSVQQQPQQRQSERSYQERPATPPAATPQTRPSETERPQPPSERPSAVPPPNEKTLPPTGRDRENQRREGPGDRVAPPRELPPARETPQPTPQQPERDQRQGQDRDKEERHP